MIVLIMIVLNVKEDIDIHMNLMINHVMQVIQINVLHVL